MACKMSLIYSFTVINNNIMCYNKLSINELIASEKHNKAYLIIKIHYAIQLNFVYNNF